MKYVILLSLMFTGCNNQYSVDNPCSHTIDNYDDFSGFCWCDPNFCKPSSYKPGSEK